LTDHTRKLATIVALDVAGYSARTEADEAKTIAQVANLRPIVEGIAKTHGGRVFNTAGDGFMLEFASSLSGVNAALELADECRPRVRVGVHVGEVSVQPNGDLLGHGVNVAARLMAKAEPGSAIISADVCRLIRGPLAERFVSRGPVQLDKMNETIEIYAPAAGAAHPAAPPKSTPAAASAVPWQQWLTPRVAAMAGAPVLLVALALLLWGWSSGTSPSGDAAPAASIAVLPFADMSSERDQQYFSDGISEEVLNVLAQVKDLRVAGRTSSFAFKGQNKDLRQIGEILGVGYIVEGSIRKSGNKVRVTAQLIQAKDGYHQWSNTYDRDLNDIFTVQDEIAKAIVTEMSEAVPALAAASKTLKASARADNISAYDRFLLAREKMTMDGGRKAYQEAAKLLDESIAADPNYTPALAWRAYAAQMLSDTPGAIGTTPVKQALPVVKAFVDRALAQDPQSAEALFALGSYYGLLTDAGDGKQIDRAIETLRKAIAIRPNFPQAENDLAYFLGQKGERAESVKILGSVLQRDPGLRDANVIYANYLVSMGRFDEAEAALGRWAKVSPNQASSVKAMRVAVLGQQGKLAAASRIVDELTAAGYVDNAFDIRRASIRLALGDGDGLLGADIPSRRRALGALLKGDTKRALELLAGDPAAATLSQALGPYVVVRYAASDIDGIVSYYDDKLGSPAAAVAARNACNCSMLHLVLALRQAGHKDTKSVLAAWKATLAEQQALYKNGPLFQRELADVAALDGDFASAKAHYTAAIDAGWRAPLFLDQSLYGFLPKDEAFNALRTRMKALVNKERTALGMPPL
jgi:TolB-like protein/class 3 adenylate cyclase/Tfp pilus assembly protein PilF